jgi:hypothetical protein
MAKLNIIVPDIFIRECFVGLCKFDEIVVQSFDGLVLRRVGSDFVRVKFERQSLIMRPYLLL